MSHLEQQETFVNAAQSIIAKERDPLAAVRAAAERLRDAAMALGRLEGIRSMPCLLEMGEPQYGECLTRTEPLTMWTAESEDLVTEPMGPEHYCTRCMLVAAALAEVKR